MGDLFHEDVDFEFIDEIVKVMEKTPQHTYQILTKRPKRMANYCGSTYFPSNVWLGVTICSQKEVEENIPWLIHASIGFRTGHKSGLFISIEPLLEQIDLEGYLSYCYRKKIDWVICGGETGRNARPMNPDWARSIRDQCRLSETPFFFKQMSNKQPIPDDLCVREFPMMGGER